MRDNGFANEDIFQAKAFEWTWNHKEWEPLRRTYLHPANEREVSSKKHLVKLKQDEAKGMVPGAYDFIFMMPSFAIELKQPGESLNKNQIKFKAALDACKIPNYVCFYMEDFQEIVEREVAKIKWW